MNDPKNPSPSGRSPFALRASRQAETTPPVTETSRAPEPAPAASPQPAKRKGAPTAAILAILAGVAVVALGAGVLYFISGDERRAYSTAARAPVPALPVARPIAPADRYKEALALVLKHGGEKISPGEFSKILVKESDARAALVAKKPSVADHAYGDASRAAETLAVEAASKTADTFFARPVIPDLRDFAGDTWAATHAFMDTGAAAAKAGDPHAAALAYDRAVDSLPAITAAARTRVASLASEAVTRSDAPSAKIFYRKLATLDPANPAAADWLMRNIASGTTIRTGKLGFAFGYAAPGAFTEGSPAAEPGRDADEVRRAVTISKGFWMGATAITQAQWDAVMGRGAVAAKLSREAPRFIGADLPMIDVTWPEAVAFCRKLSAIEGSRFRLPTEAEWEYACRAGSDAAYANGKSFLNPGEAVVDDGTTGAPDAPKPVDATSAIVNAWGLRDMHGNVWEWCADRYAPWTRDAVTDPVPPAAGASETATKVVRGGSWNDPAKAARSAKRWQYPPAVAVNYIGFRPVMEFDASNVPE